MDDRFETGYIEINARAYEIAQGYGREVRRLKDGIRAVAADLDALDHPGCSVLAAQLQALLDP